MLEKLMDSPIAWTVLAVLAVLSFFYAIYCQHKNKEKKEFSYLKQSNNLIRKKKSKFEKLSVSYDGQEIEDLCITKFTIWNSGNKTLNDVDIVKNKELTIATCDDDKILDVELIICSEETNEFRIVKIDERTVKIMFDYVDKKDGVVIQIIHTGTSDSINIKCKIKGGNSLKSNVNDASMKIFKKVFTKVDIDKFFVVFACILIVFTLFLAGVFTIAIFNEQLQSLIISKLKEDATVLQNPQLVAVVISILFWFMGGLLTALYYPIIKRLFNMGVPKKLKTHTDFSD